MSLNQYSLQELVDELYNRFHGTNTEQKNISNFKLGRLFASDDKDNNYPITLLLSKAKKSIAKTKFWGDKRWSGNQGETSQCVAYAWTHWIEDGPVVPKSKIIPIINPIIIYNEAQKIDEWAGTKHDGTTVRAAAKVLQRLGFILNYYWANSVNQIAQTVLQIGPVVVGTNWYEDMFYPDTKTFFISPTGSLAGGHGYEINGVDTVKKYFRIKNSWGLDWGDKGHAYITFDNFNKLLLKNGEACLATENPNEKQVIV